MKKSSCIYSHEVGVKVSSIHETVRAGGKDELQATSHNEGWDENVTRKMVLMEGSIM
jgi:hypothetical protein